MTAITSKIAEVGLPAMEEPKFAIAAGVLFTAATVLDAYKLHLDAQTSSLGVPIADPEIAEVARVDGRKTRLFSRIGYYAAVGFASLMVAQESQPYTTHKEAKGGASVVIDAGYGAEVQDMGAESSNPNQTRLDASVDGSLAAAKENSVPFSFILEGSRARVVDTTPARHKDLEQTRERIDTALTPDFRNGQSMADGVEQALTLAGGGPNNVIMIAANLRPGDVRSIQNIKKRIKHNFSGDSLHAVVVGRGQGSIQVGNVSLASPSDAEEFKKLLGDNNVETAHSSAEVEKAISNIVNKVQVTEKKEDSNIFRDSAIIAAALGAAVALRRRLSGITKSRGLRS